MSTNSLSEALDDIRVIKDSIGVHKSPYKKVYRFLFILGIVNLIDYLLTIAGTVIWDFHLSGNIYSILSLALRWSMYLLLFFYFVKIYKEEMISTNKYYLGFLSIFAGIVFLLPAVMLIMRFLVSFTAASGVEVSDSFIYLHSITSFANILLFCFILILAGFILKKPTMFITSTILFLTYLIISVIYSDVYYVVGPDPRTFVSLHGMYYNLVISMGYILVALIFRKQLRVG